MTIELTHSFIYRCLNKEELLFKVTKFNTFERNLLKQAKKYGNGNANKENEYKGWGFELFGEMLVKTFSYDKRIGVHNLQFSEEDDDTGVDGYGMGTNGKPATVQFKYRKANYTLKANEDHLSNFISASQNRYNVDINDEKNMIIITSGKDLHYYTKDNMLYGKVRCLNRDKIRTMVDNNIPFWSDFLNSWNKSLS